MASPGPGRAVKGPPAARPLWRQGRAELAAAAQGPAPKDAPLHAKNRERAPRNAHLSLLAAFLEPPGVLPWPLAAPPPFSLPFSAAPASLQTGDLRGRETAGDTISSGEFQKVAALIRRLCRGPQL